jgi:aminomethyltransferase
MNTTPLNAWHHAHQGRMVDFAGWEMPVQYSSIVEEHLAVRSSAGVFDISHMGRLSFRGESAAEFLNQILTNDTAAMEVGDVRYSLVCNPSGGILDDVLIYRLPDRWELVVNASNREKIVDWIRNAARFSTVEFADQTLVTGMIAIQGPQALEIVAIATGTDFSDLKYYSTRDASIFNLPAVVSRTGYTGEDGLELVVSAEQSQAVWKALLDAGQTFGIKPAGLGCRDTLRLEAAMPLYGHELNELTDPLSAGLQFAVKLQKADFTGKAALEAIKRDGVSITRVGLVLEGRRIAREESPVQFRGSVIGKVTSGTFSPTLQKVIAMAYMPPSDSALGTKVEVNLRGSLVPAAIVRLPFYKRKGLKAP